MPVTIARKIDELWDQLDNIDELCQLFFERQKFTSYKSIAVALRLVLTGSSGAKGLVHDVLPSATYAPLRVKATAGVPFNHMVIPAQISIKRGMTQAYIGEGTRVRYLNVAGGAVGAMLIGTMLDQVGSVLALSDWLAQPFLRPEWTIRSFIATVVNKDGGAHLDSNAQLLAMEKWGYFHWHLTAGIARDMHPQLISQLLKTYANHARAVR
jgi:hypothetical protein